MRHFAEHVSLKRWAINSLLLLYGWSIVAQDIPIGTWRTHFSYNDARLLTASTDKLFCAVENGLFSRDLESGETRKLSKIDGLSSGDS